MGKALYRTYRSKKLSEVVGQDHITRTLENALKQGKISHAYLFTGPRGVGKTSVARILAHEINNLPYTDESQHIDIIEIDAASNRRIDEIRELRDKARLSPLEAPYKVYIIDEVHMLTREAFNALLKTLEEPPQHVIFILATTEVHKLPETIVSRTQRYSFRPIDNKSAVNHLKTIAKKEKINIDDEALELIAEHGKGSFRDSISLLDQISNTEDQITIESVRQHLGVPSQSLVKKIVDSLKSKDSTDLLKTLDEAQSHGIQAAILASQLAKEIRSDLLEGNLEPRVAMNILRGLLGVDGARQPYQELELILLEDTLTEQSPQAPKQEANKPEPVEKAVRPRDGLNLQSELDNGLWEKVLDNMRGKHNTLYGIARMAVASTDGDVLVLGFAFDFHRRRINEERNQQKLQAIITDILGSPIEVRCEINKSGPKEAPKLEKSDTLKSITEVFGGGEVLED